MFIALLRSLSDKDNKKQALLDIARLRAQLAITHAFDGFDIETSAALDLIKSSDDNLLTELDKEKKDRLVAAINNLIEFAVCEEYQLMREVYETIPDFDFDTEIYDPESEDNEDNQELLIALCKKYNLTYAKVENDDIEYAMAIALAWIKHSKDSYLTYMTQNDDRVRPWHFALQGFTAQRDEFPSWMIPPIEWGCRCFLVDHEGDSVQNNTQIRNIKDIAIPSKPEQLDNVFSESVAKCGRIFGKSHSYFLVGDKDKDTLKDIVELIKCNYYGN